MIPLAALALALVLFVVVAVALAVADTIAGIVWGPDPDLVEPWDPRR